MSADFWAGYISGAVGIVIGNPLDILKVRLQASLKPNTAPSTPPTPPVSPLPSPSPSSTPAATVTPTRLARLTAGTAAPVLGYGALNALLFVSYHRSEAVFKSILSLPPDKPNLWTTWLGGAAGGLASWVVSAPTEVVKCRAQLGLPFPSGSTETGNGGGTSSSWRVAKQIWLSEGVRGFYFGGAVTALRDSVGYGFYFWSYQLGTRYFARPRDDSDISAGISSPSGGFISQDALKVLLCGGIAGIVTWASIFPLDVIKTRMQAQPLPPPHPNLSPSASAATAVERRPLLGAHSSSSESSAAGKPGHRLGAVQIAREAYREGGIGVFFRGLGVCSVRAFIVNAVQWAVYEWIMVQLVGSPHGRVGVKTAPGAEII
jgi:solute carrier family 25 (mitochondrial carnitine/acylcarnitine transporter), member 20/29